MADAPTRKNLARRYFPELFHDATLIIDGTDCPVQLFCRRYDQQSREYYSFKFKAPGLRTQVALLANLVVAWTSNSIPCATHDKIHLERSDFEQVTNLADGELAMTDLGYQGLRYVLVPHKRLPHRTNNDCNSADPFTNLWNIRRAYP
jgi:hypothetical protein